MNTSHNKNRVIEHGWNNVFKNIFRYKNTKISPVNSSSSEKAAQSQRTTDNSKRKQGINIFAITASRDSKREVERFSGQRFSAPVASTSNRLFGTDPQQRKASDSSLTSIGLVNAATQKCDRELNNFNSYILNADSLNLKDNKQVFSLILIQKMSENKDDEEKYLEYFKRLVSFEEFCKDKESFGIDELENEILIPQNDILKITHEHVKSKGRELKSGRKTKKAGNKSDVFCEDCDESETPVENIKSTQDSPKIERIVMRSEILSRLLSCYINDFNYDSLMNELIDLEESLIQS